MRYFLPHQNLASIDGEEQNDDDQNDDQEVMSSMPTRSNSLFFWQFCQDLAENEEL